MFPNFTKIEKFIQKETDHIVKLLIKEAIGSYAAGDISYFVVWSSAHHPRGFTKVPRVGRVMVQKNASSSFSEVDFSKIDQMHAGDVISYLKRSGAKLVSGADVLKFKLDKPNK